MREIKDIFVTLGFSLCHFAFILWYLQTANGYHITEVQWSQGCNVIGFQGTSDPEWPLIFFQ